MNNQRGQSIIEISLMTPMLLIALYVPVDFGMSIFAAHLTNNAVREVARITAAQAPGTFDSTASKADLDARLPKNVALMSSAVTKLSTDPVNCMAIVEATATVEYPFFWYRIMRLFGASVPATLSITRTAQMRYDYQPSDTTSVPCTSA